LRSFLCESQLCPACSNLVSSVNSSENNVRMERNRNFLFKNVEF